MSSKTAISEATAIVRARAFVRAAGVDGIPIDLDKLAAAANAEIRVSRRLAPGEAGNTMFVRERHLITVNGNDSLERQRFTVLHELGHIVLELPSQHGASANDDALYSYVRRPPEEVICDTFAAECLLPHEFLKRDLKDASATFSFIEELAGRYKASLACTASRVAVNASFACAYVLSQGGYVRFAAYSTLMREARFWITPGVAVPQGSITGQCLTANSSGAAGLVPAHLWTLADAFSDVDIYEDVRNMSSWSQGLTLISLDRGDTVDAQRVTNSDETDDGEPLLRELDGNLSWPGKKRRR